MHAEASRTWTEIPVLTGYSWWLYEVVERIGFCRFSTGMERIAEALSFVEIVAWSGLPGNELSAWEAEAVHTLSAVYASGLMEFKDKAAPRPYVTELSAERDAIERSERRMAELRGEK